jgi:hypothetical protein
MEYASSIWDPHQAVLITTIETIQCRAARFVFNEYTDTSPVCVTHLLDQLGWNILQHRGSDQRLVLMYKIHHQSNRLP